MFSFCLTFEVVGVLVIKCLLRVRFVRWTYASIFNYTFECYIILLVVMKLLMRWRGSIVLFNLILILRHIMRYHVVPTDDKCLIFSLLKVCYNVHV